MNDSTDTTQPGPLVSNDQAAAGKPQAPAGLRQQPTGKPKSPAGMQHSPAGAQPSPAGGYKKTTDRRGAAGEVAEAPSPRDFSAYMYTQKAEFMAGLQHQLDEINRQIDKLSEKARASSEKARATADAEVKKLTEHAYQTRTRLEKVGEADESTWDDAKRGILEAKEQLKKLLHNAGKWVVDKTD